MQNFICPCCGHGLKFTQELGMFVAETVTDFYGIPLQQVFIPSRSKADAPEYKVKPVICYFIRQFTGEKFKVISIFLKYMNHNKAGDLYRKLEAEMDQNDELRREIVRVQQILLAKFVALNLKVA